MGEGNKNIDQVEEIKIRDTEALHYDEWYLNTKGYLFDWVEKQCVINALNIRNKDIILDAGCGTGRLTLQIAKLAKKVYAIDFSEMSIAVLNKKLKENKINNVVSMVGNILDIPPINDKVNKILSVQVIQHIPTYERRLKALSNLYEILEPGGEIVITLYHFNCLSKLSRTPKEGFFNNGIYFYRFTKNEAMKLLELVGFKQVTAKTYIHLVGYKISNSLLRYRLLSKLVPLMGSFDLFLSNFYIPFGRYLIVKGIK